MTATRRDILRLLLQGAGCFAALATAPFSPLVRPAKATSGRIGFDQGVASADPQPDAILLWTRAAPTDTSDRVDLVVQVSADPSFETVILETTAEATIETDFTVRIFAQGLAPDTTYFYRFLADGIASGTGRTRTAPAPDADRTVRLAWAACQGIEWGFFGGWRRMIVDDEKAPPGEGLDLVVHVGDFIYEEGGLSLADIEHQQVHGENKFLRDRFGRDRTPLPFPSGGRGAHYGEAAAANLADYRHLYKFYLSDPNLRAARARWPFVCTWDDHEFSNNCWQSHTGSAAFQTGKAAANRAWFEYVPAVLSASRPSSDVAPRARDFEAVTVENVAFGEPGEPKPEAETNNLAAIGSMTLYRSLKFGRNVDLFVTDVRSYRSDHCIPESWAKEYFDGPVPKTPELIRTLDAGREANGGNPPSEIVSGDVRAPNPRRDSAAGTLLGRAQREWLEAGLASSDATWKLWANAVPAMTITLDFDTIPFSGAPRIILSDDAWDGYPGERASLLRFLTDKGIENVVSLSGDLHMHLAGSVASDPLDPDSMPVLAEFATGGIASASTFRVLRKAAPMLDGLAVAVLDEDDPTLELWNNSLRNGVLSSMVYRTTGSLRLARWAANKATNPHLAWVDSNAVGYGLVTAGPDRCKVELVTLPAPLEDPGEDPPPVLRRVRFELSPGEKVPVPLTIDGPPPFPVESI